MNLWVPESVGNHVTGRVIVEVSRSTVRRGVSYLVKGKR